jgi:hypothetical protein
LEICSSVYPRRTSSLLTPRASILSIYSDVSCAPRRRSWLRHRSRALRGDSQCQSEQRASQQERFWLRPGGISLDRGSHGISLLFH